MLYYFFLILSLLKYFYYRLNDHDILEINALKVLCLEKVLKGINCHFGLPSLLFWRRQWHRTPVLLPENPVDGGAWWAAVYGVAQSQTQLKRLSSSSSSSSLLSISLTIEILAMAFL